MNRFRCACLVSLVLSSTVLLSQTAPSPEAGKFVLHKFEQAIGEENYTITPDHGMVTFKSEFKFTDRGTPVALSATLITEDYRPQSFTVKGKTSRLSNIDTEITNIHTPAGGGPWDATLRQGTDTHAISFPAAPFFTISGYAPVAVQMEMMRYWRAHGQPAQLATLPSRRSEDSGPRRRDDSRSMAATCRSSATPSRG